MNLSDWWAIISGITLILFTSGKLWERYNSKNKNVDTKVESHDTKITELSKKLDEKEENHNIKINELSDKVDKMAAKVNLVESENNKNTTNIHKLKEDVGLLKYETQNNFHLQDKKLIITIGMLERIGDKIGITFQTDNLINK